MLSNYQIMLITSSHPCTVDKESGVFPINGLPLQPKTYPAFWIVNSVKADEKYGHWFSIFFPHHNEPAEFYCPLGKKPQDYSPVIEPILFAAGDARYKTYNTPSQPANSTSCGYFCLWFVDQRCRNYSFEVCMGKLSKDDLQHNEVKVVNYVVEHMKPPAINLLG